MNLIILECSNCHSIQKVDTNHREGYCNVCGCKLYESDFGDTLKLYEKYARKVKLCRLKNRVIFVVLEMLSLLFTICFCMAFSFVLDTRVFMENNWLIYAVWVIIAYYIYKKFEYKIR